MSPDNPDGLPVGFAKDIVIDPKTGEKSEVIGFTCSACHTGQLNYKGKGVRIDGGSAMADPAAFQAELGYAVAFTDKIPFRFDRFARAVLGDNASSDAKKQLKKEFTAFLNTGLKENQAHRQLRFWHGAGQCQPARGECAREAAVPLVYRLVRARAVQQLHSAGHDPQCGRGAGGSRQSQPRGR